MKQAGLGAGGMPVVYISELVGLAAGLAPRAVGLDRHFIDAMGIAERSR
jgi:heterodisulfide reductase subunit B